MPIYEFHCTDCGRQFEFLAFKRDEAPAACPHCNGEHVNKMMSACCFNAKNAAGETSGRTAGVSSCGSCAASSCAGCGSA
ncbi:MAG: FmdB family transcriptional regulator [Desulfobacterales bacterium]|nr:MAG: FmdB family transcriptional regulator [Desulfobacterales bacterium]